MEVPEPSGPQEHYVDQSTLTGFITTPLYQL